MKKKKTQRKKYDIMYKQIKFKEIYNKYHTKKLRQKVFLYNQKIIGGHL